MAGETCNHIRVQVVSRSTKGNAVAAAAYRSGQKLEDVTQEKTYDYSRKAGVFHSEILVPEHMKGVEWVQDREWLWNEVEAKESQSKRAANARLFREVMIPLPHELSTEQRQELTRRYVKEQFVSKGMIADVSYHNMEGQDPKENAHAHVMLTMREVSQDGFGKKNREWDKKQNLEHWREEWTRTANEMSREWGQELELDHRSYEERGINRIPEQHMGAAYAMEQRGIKTQLGDHNRAIQLSNQELAMKQEQIQQPTQEQTQQTAQEWSLEEKLEWHEQQRQRIQKAEEREKALQRYIKYLKTREGRERDVFEIDGRLFAEQFNQVSAQQQRDMGLSSLYDPSMTGKPAFNTLQDEKALEESIFEAMYQSNQSQTQEQSQEMVQEQSLDDDYGMEMHR